MVGRVVAITFVLFAAVADAHPLEWGITIEPAFAGTPAFADSNSIPTLALAAGGGIGVEFMPIKYLALVSHFTYVHAVTRSHIGRATFELNTGDYYFSQSGFLARAGLRIETPSWWLPFQLFAEVTGGAAVLIQENRQLADDRNVLYEVPLPTLVKVTPIVGLTGGFFIRATEHVRFNVDGTALLMPGSRLGVGFIVSLGLTFLFLT